MEIGNMENIKGNKMMDANKEYTQMDEDDTSPENIKTDQTLHIPKGRDYTIPDEGKAMIEFKKIGEDETGCEINVLNFEPEGEAEGAYDNEYEEDSESTNNAVDQVDNLFARRNATGIGVY